MNPCIPFLLVGLLAVLSPPAAATAQAGVDDGRDAGAQSEGEGEAGAVEAGTAYAPDTGDPLVDLRLADINVYAARFPEAFADELARYFDAPRDLLEQRIAEGVPPGDLYYACALARVTGRPCRGVLAARRAEAADAGWEPVARRFGVEPGDERARRLRDGMAGSYARWGRPLPGG